LPIAFIDHHASTAKPGIADYLDESASAVTAMVYEVMKAMGHKPTREEARLLFWALH